MGGGAILYLHGGAYVVCSPQTHRSITGRLAVDTGLPVLVPDYRLAHAARGVIALSPIELPVMQMPAPAAAPKPVGMSLPMA